MSYWCKTCREPVKIEGPPGLFPSLQRAVHAATGEETGPGYGDDGFHAVLPADEDPVLRAQADALEEELGGLFVISARFGIFRADWAGLGPGDTAPNYSAATAGELRPRLEAAAVLHHRTAAAVPGPEARS